MESKTNKLIDFFVADKSMTEYSSKMEPLAAKICLTRLRKRKVEVRVCTTDRSSSLKTMMRSINSLRVARGLTPIKHSFDVWHFIKSVMKDLFLASKLKKGRHIGLWMPSVKNMLWYSIAECKGDADLLREMVLSIPQHCSGVHVFPDNRHFQRCLHGDLPEGDEKHWIPKDSFAMRKLVAALRGPNNCRLKDLELLTEFQHTGTNENINSLHNKYLPKSCSYGHTQSIVRACLTAIDHNTNVNRQVTKDEDGEDKYSIVNSRDGKQWTAKAIREPKNTAWRQRILTNVLTAVRSGMPVKGDIPTDEELKKYSNKVPKPNKEDVIAATRANKRFREADTEKVAAASQANRTYKEPDMELVLNTTKVLRDAGEQLQDVDVGRSGVPHKRFRKDRTKNLVPFS